MKPFIASRSLRAALAGLCALALQMLPIPYGLEVLGSESLYSPTHLHAGFVLALAMLFCDRIYFRTAFACVLLGWFWRAWSANYALSLMIAMVPNYAIMYAWTIGCARWMGWPRSDPDQRITREDVARFAIIGLLLYPLGWAVSDYVLDLFASHWSPYESLSDTVQTFFAKHFGVSIVTLPLVMLLSERPRKRNRFGAGDLVLWGMLMLGLGANLFIALVLQPHDHDKLRFLTEFFDYRFALVAILTWCALRMNPRMVMPILMGVQLLLVIALSQEVPPINGLVGVLGLLKVAFELSVLQLLIVVLMILDRDSGDLLDKLRKESQHEAITGLRNLNALREEAQRMLPAPREIAYLSLANLDRLTGGFGLRAQEALMQQVAAHLADRVESYHMGIGQFALLAKNNATPTIWNDVLQGLEYYSFRYAGENLRLTPYLGVAALDGTTPKHIDDALDAASTAAQDAALRSETRPVRARPATSTSSASRDALTLGSLALARVKARELELYFQPIMRIDEPLGQPIRYGEILCRLRDDNGKLLMPDVFIHELELQGRSSELDMAVIECLFAWLRARPDPAHSMRFSINLTGRSLVSEPFREFVLDQLDRSPIALTNLCFEITESEAIARFSDARRLLDDLRKRGCSIALDDFGVGMQSLERLRELPFDVIKIDGSFVRGVVARTRDYELVRASVAIARACGADVIAEYVETAEIAACLRELGVPWGQGHHFAEAAPIDAVLAQTV